MPVEKHLNRINEMFLIWVFDGFSFLAGVEDATGQHGVIQCKHE